MASLETAYGDRGLTSMDSSAGKADSSRSPYTASAGGEEDEARTMRQFTDAVEEVEGSVDVNVDVGQRFAG